MTSTKPCSGLDEFQAPLLGIQRMDSESAGTVTGLVTSEFGTAYLMSAAHVMAWGSEREGVVGDALRMPYLAAQHGMPAKSVIARLQVFSPRDPGPGKQRTSHADAAIARVEPGWIEPLEALLGGYLTLGEIPARGENLTLRGGCNGTRQRKLTDPNYKTLTMHLPRDPRTKSRIIRIKGSMFSEPGLGNSGDSGGAVFNAKGHWIGVYIGRTPSTGVERGGVIIPATSALKYVGL